MSTITVLPPGSTPLERALEQAAAGLLDFGTPVRAVWSADDCPMDLLPWLGWGLSLDNWDSGWSEDVKRDAVRTAIPMARQKGTRAALRATIDRFDPAIDIVEWHEADPPMPQHLFRLNLPLAADSDVEYTDELVARLARDVAAVKPVRSHMKAAHFLTVTAPAYLLAAANPAGFVRTDMAADIDAASDPYWDTLLQTESGSPLSDDAGTLWEHE